VINELLQYSNPVLEFLTLNSIYALLLAGIVLLIKIFYRGLPKRIEYGMWCLVLIRLVLPVELSFEYAVPAFATNWLFTDQGPQTVSEFLNWKSSGAAYLANGGVTSVSVMQGVYLVWLAVVAIVFFSYLLLRIKLLRMINRSHPIVEYPIVACANRWRLNFWIKRPVHVIALDKYMSPFTFFFKTPIIFIPKKIIESNNEVLIESIIAHEMAHVKRRDSLWLILQNLIQIGYFFNPLVWLVVRKLSALRENLCDEMVLSSNKVKPAQYGESLLQVLRFNISGDMPTVLSNAFLGYKNQIQKRVSAIGNFEFGQSHPRIELCWVCVFAIFFLPFAHQASSQSSPQTPNIIWKKDSNSPFPKYIEEQIQLPVIVEDD